MTSRGCPYGRNWCAKLFGRRYAQRPASVAEELRQLKADVGPDHVWFADDIFGLTARWIAEFAEAVRARDARIPFMIQCRADLITPTVARNLALLREIFLRSSFFAASRKRWPRAQSLGAGGQRPGASGIRARGSSSSGTSEEWRRDRDTRPRATSAPTTSASVAYPLPGTSSAAVQAQLARARTGETGELAMLFQGTYTTAFYRQLRDALHDEVRDGADEPRWFELGEAAAAHRLAQPVGIAEAEE